jgi:phosphoribosyl-dephospho-CoA transferase
MTPLHRHQLACLSPAGWRKVCRRDWDATALDCLTYWAEHRLPLVVARQTPEDDCADTIAMGLAAPSRWGRRRISLRVSRGDVLYFDEFPRADRIPAPSSAAAREAWGKLCALLAACGVMARVYGSHGWRQLSGLDHVRSGSDIDLWIAVSNPEQADAVGAVLESFASGPLRLDGELIFEGDAAVAWREWMRWRAGGAKALLVKTISGSSLERALTWCRADHAMESRS